MTLFRLLCNCCGGRDELHYSAGCSRNHILCQACAVRTHRAGACSIDGERSRIEDIREALPPLLVNLDRLIPHELSKIVSTIKYEKFQAQNYLKHVVGVSMLQFQKENKLLSSELKQLKEKVSNGDVNKVYQSENYSLRKENAALRAMINELQTRNQSSRPLSNHQARPVAEQGRTSVPVTPPFQNAQTRSSELRRPDHRSGRSQCSSPSPNLRLTPRCDSHTSSQSSSSQNRLVMRTPPAQRTSLTPKSINDPPLSQGARGGATQPRTSSDLPKYLPRASAPRDYISTPPPQKMSTPSFTTRPAQLSGSAATPPSRINFPSVAGRGVLAPSTPDMWLTPGTTPVMRLPQTPVFTFKR